MDLKAKRLSARYTSLIFLLLLVFFGLSLAGNLVAWLRLYTLINSR